MLVWSVDGGHDGDMTRGRPTRITRDVDAGQVADLAFAPPRVVVAAIVDGEVCVWPAAVAVTDPTAPGSSGRLVTIPDGAPALGGRDVVVLADDGPQWFRLRALMIRGRAVPEGPRCYRVQPRRVVAWDYGALREVEANEVPTPASFLPPVHAAVASTTTALRSARLEAALQTSRVLIVVTRSAKGTVFAVPLWFVVHRHKIYATTNATSWTVRNVIANPQVAVLLGGERRGESDYLSIRGRAEAVPGPPPPSVLARIAARYYLAPRFAGAELASLPLWGRRVRYYAQAQAAHLVITPETATAWSDPG